MSPIEIVLSVLLAVTLCGGAWVAYHLIDQNGRLMLRLEYVERRLIETGILTAGFGSANRGLPPGSVLNDFALPLLSGGTMTLSQWRGRKIALIFLNPRCSHCVKLLPDLVAALPVGTDADPAALIVSTGSVEENRRFFGDRVSCPVVLQEDSEASSLYMVVATPMAYLVDEHGTTLGPALIGGAAILDTLRGKIPPAETPAGAHTPVAGGSVISSQVNRDGLKAGTPAPDFTLPALDGSEISLGSFRGKPVLLVFSDPACAPCNELSPQLEQIHRQSDDLQVLMISRGGADANRQKARQLGLTFPIVLQQSWEISRAYGMFATPIAYLVGEDGVLAGDVAVGGNAILALAAQRRNAGVPC